jgi:hypothetical protein
VGLVRPALPSTMLQPSTAQQHPRLESAKTSLSSVQPQATPMGSARPVAASSGRQLESRPQGVPSLSPSPTSSARQCNQTPLVHPDTACAVMQATPRPVRVGLHVQLLGTVIVSLEVTGAPAGLLAGTPTKGAAMDEAALVQAAACAVAASGQRISWPVPWPIYLISTRDSFTHQLVPVKEVVRQRGHRGSLHDESGMP